MIYTQVSRITESNEFPLQPNVSIAVEGQALVRTYTNGVIGVAPSQGVADEVFVGFSLMHTTGISVKQFSTVFAREHVLASAVVPLGREPIAGSVFIYNKATGAAVTLGALTGTNQAVTGTTVGDVVVAVYRPVLTEIEATFVYGDGQPSGYAGNSLRQVGVAQAGLIFTDHFDTSVNWATVPSVVLGANGIVTSEAVNATGVVINAHVMHRPTQDIPFLGLQFNAGA